MPTANLQSIQMSINIHIHPCSWCQICKMLTSFFPDWGNWDCDAQSALLHHWHDKNGSDKQGWGMWLVLSENVSFQYLVILWCIQNHRKQMSYTADIIQRCQKFQNCHRWQSYYLLTSNVSIMKCCLIQFHHSSSITSIRICKLWQRQYSWCHLTEEGFDHLENVLNQVYYCEKVNFTSCYCHTENWRWGSVRVKGCEVMTVRRNSVKNIKY